MLVTCREYCLKTIKIPISQKMSKKSTVTQAKLMKIDLKHYFLVKNKVTRRENTLL